MSENPNTFGVCQVLFDICPMFPYSRTDCYGGPTLSGKIRRTNAGATAHRIDPGEFARPPPSQAASRPCLRAYACEPSLGHPVATYCISSHWHRRRLIPKARCAKIRNHYDAERGPQVAYVWGLFQLGSLTASLFVGPVADAFDPQVIFWFWHEMFHFI